MYRLMKSEKFTLDHLTSGLISFYRQTQVKHFRQFRSALGACEVANNNGRSRYYHCPHCTARTLVKARGLDIFNPPRSPFPDDLQATFGAVPESRAALDFYCRGCSRPVRLLFWGQERGMGGWWYGYVTTVLELR